MHVPFYLLRHVPFPQDVQLAYISYVIYVSLEDILLDEKKRGKQYYCLKDQVGIQTRKRLQLQFS